MKIVYGANNCFSRVAFCSVLTKKVGTPRINPIYSLLNNKKGLSETENPLLVELAVIATASDG